MAVVESESIEHPREELTVLGHVIPEERVVRGLFPVSKLDAVSPDDDFSTEVGFGGLVCEVGERIGVPDPTVVGESEGRRGVLGGGGVGGETGEVGADEGGSDGREEAREGRKG